MKWSFANVGLIIFCLFGIIIVTFFNELTVSNEQDYYTLKDAVEASMIDAVDVTYFRLTGSIKINQEKFVELLTRRFSEVATFGQGNYDLEFYQISESPPKVSVRVVDSTNRYNIFGTFGAEPTDVNVVNEITAIMDIYKGAPLKIFSAGDLNPVDYSIPPYPDDTIYEYEDEYYYIPAGTVIPSGECELYDDRIECKDNTGNVIVLEEIPDDFIPDEPVIPEEPEIPDEPVIPEEPEIPDEENYIKVYKNNIYSVRIGSGPLGRDTITPKYDFYITYNGQDYYVVSGNVSAFDKDKCVLNGNTITCGGVVFSQNSINCCYKASNSWYVIYDDYCNTRQFPFGCTYNMCIHELKGNTLVISGHSTSRDYMPRTNYAVKDIDGICN